MLILFCELYASLYLCLSCWTTFAFSLLVVCQNLILKYVYTSGVFFLRIVRNHSFVADRLEVFGFVYLTFYHNHFLLSCFNSFVSGLRTASKHWFKFGDKSEVWLYPFRLTFRCMASSWDNRNGVNTVRRWCLVSVQITKKRTKAEEARVRNQPP